MDPDDIQAKSGNTYRRLDLNYLGGDLSIGDQVFYMDRISSRIGINTKIPQFKLDINGGTWTSNDGVRTTYSSGHGAAFLANNDLLGGWFVVNGALDWAPLWGHSFNVFSDAKMKKQIQPIHEKNCLPYLEYLKNLETVTYLYDQEGANDIPHIGILAHTAPREIVNQVSKDPRGGDESALSVSLGDWIGLNTVVIKYLVKQIEQLQQDLQLLKLKME